MRLTNEVLRLQAKEALIKYRAYALPKDGFNTEARLKLSKEWLQAYKNNIGLMSNNKLASSVAKELMPNFVGVNTRDFELIEGDRYHVIEFTYDIYSSNMEKWSYEMRNYSSLTFTNKREAKKTLKYIQNNLI